MDAKSLLEFFLQTDHYELKKGMALGGFMSDWIGEFYAYYQWQYDIPSRERHIPINVRGW